MLTLELWYRDSNLRELCDLSAALLPRIGAELLGDPAQRVEMGMVAAWDLVRLAGSPVYLGLTEGELHFGVLGLFTDRLDPELIAAFEQLLAKVWSGDFRPLPEEAFLVRGMDEFSGPILSLAPVTPRVLQDLRLVVGDPLHKSFAPQIRVVGPRLAGMAGTGAFSTMARRHVTGLTASGGALWLDLAWSVWRPQWSPP